MQKYNFKLYKVHHRKHLRHTENTVANKIAGKFIRSMAKEGCLIYRVI